MKAGTHSFTLRLPDTFRGVHPVFHVSMLEPTFLNEIPNHVQSLPLLVDIEGKLEYENSLKINKRQSCKLLYLVHWLGYKNTDEELSWLPATELEHADELISDFHSTYLQKPGPISKS